jgi:YggT family protein
MLIRILCIVLQVYWVILFARILLSWFPPPRSGPARSIVELVYDVTDPVLNLVRGLLPPIRMGMAGLDLSPILVFVAIYVIQASLGCV